jgi:hypothetical protein
MTLDIWLFLLILIAVFSVPAFIYWRRERELWKRVTKRLNTLEEKHNDLAFAHAVVRGENAKLNERVTEQGRRIDDLIKERDEWRERFRLLKQQYDDLLARVESK